MKAAIYARKSTEQRGDEETRSIARQIADARAFAKRMNLPSIPNELIYADDAVSGRDVRNLKARARLMADVDAGQIQIVVMADMSRFSRREGDEVVRELRQIARKADVWFYESGSRFQAGDSGAKIATFANAVINNDYARKIATKTHAGMRMKAALGYVVGGRTFGYRNVDVMTGLTDGSGRPTRSHVTREIDAEQAKVVLEIAERYAGGQGFKKIADALNRKAAPTPRPKPQRVRGWDVSSVRSVLLQPLYRGVARWNRLRQHDDEGNPIFEINPENDHVTFENESWRIIPADIAEAIDLRFADNKAKGRGLGAHTTKGAAPRYLLSGGLMKCPTCGGNFEASRAFYECAVHRRKGSAICANRLRLKITEMDEAVLRLLDGEVLTATFIDRIIRLADGNPDDGRSRLESDRVKLQSSINALVAAIKIGGDLAPLVAEMKVCTERLAALDRQIAALPAAPPDRVQLRVVLEQRVSDWKARLLSEHLDEARFIVEQLLRSTPITLWHGEAGDFATFVGVDPNDRRGKENLELADTLGFEARVHLASLVEGLEGGRYLSLVAGGGFEPPTFGL
jgi:site-specific DNA recombinase